MRQNEADTQRKIHTLKKARRLERVRIFGGRLVTSPCPRLNHAQPWGLGAADCSAGKLPPPLGQIQLRAELISVPKARQPRCLLRAATRQ